MSADDDRGDAGRRRLRLLPEVLPDPTPSFAEGTPRQRTLAHARRLVALAAASSAIGAACTKEGTPTITKEDESVTKKSTKTEPTTTTTTTPSDAAPTASASTVTAPSIPPTGYAVVDPMPPPAKCPGLAGSIKATAVWRPGPGGAMLVELRLPRSSRADVRYLHTTPPAAYGGKITATTWTGGDVVLTLLPDKGAAYLGVYVPAACALGDERINVEITLTGTPAAGTPVAVALFDSY